MANDGQLPLIAFVFRPVEIAYSTVAMARRTGAKAIFDLSSISPDSVETDLLKAGSTRDMVDLKISSSSLMASGLEDLLNRIGINRLWVELPPIHVDYEVHALLQRIVQLSQTISVIPMVSAVDIIQLIVTGFPDIRNMAIKGNEASGFVGTETTFTLYSSVRSMLRDSVDAPDLFIWGGIALPETAAAFLSAGAKGIVFESLHWLTDLSVVNPVLRTKISKLRPHQTDLVGLNLGVPCRLFNKGNSVAVKELKRFHGSLCGNEITGETRRLFQARIVGKAVHALESDLSREELIPLGVEAAFADSFVRRYGSKTEDAVYAFVEAISSCCANSVNKARAFENSHFAFEMGTVYPFIQGAMSWITDIPEFALRVAEAGGLPTIALGVMDVATLDQRLARLPEIMGNRPYAVNVITLPENPYREVHLAWIRDKRPRFATIAAGEPSHAALLTAEGIDVLYVAPNEELLKLAFEAGIRYVICEGNEAGGHVGQHSILTLAQTVLDLKHQDPGLFEGRTIVLAGGIFNRETAFMAAMMGADAIQMGTAYLGTEEIVSSGALSQLYQHTVLQAGLNATVVTGEGTGLSVRSLKTKKIEALCKLEREFSSGVEDEASFRRKMESLSAGSLFIAARGLDQPGGRELGESTCLEEGQFMSGACAGALNEVRTIVELHNELAKGDMAAGLPFKGPVRLPSSTVTSEERTDTHSLQKTKRLSTGSFRGTSFPERIAVTAMSVANSLGKSPSEIFQASLAMKSGISLVPRSRWDHSVYYDPRPRVSEKTYCKVGAFMDLDISRKDLEIPPPDFRTMTGATKITMWLADKAIKESAILDSDIPRDRIAVLISQNSGEAAGTLEDLIIRGVSDKIVSAVKRVLNMSAETEKAVEEEIKSGRIGVDDTTLLGRLNCAAAGFICSKYGFMGPSFSVSAACATSLVALYSAVQMIRNGIIDAAIVGGGEEYLSPMHFLEFAALGSLSGISGREKPPSEASRPFDADRDGMVLGEGGGMIVIERESVAHKRGVPVHAYIISMGASNSHRGLVESASETQEIAIRHSFNGIHYGPDEVDLIECHATATRQGDGEEVRAIKHFYDSRKRTVLSSFKSQIGHTLGASGINSLIRGVMAVNSATFPATANYEKPDHEIGIDGSGLLVLREPAEWIVRDGRPRRIQVNAFGFGGSNYVVQLEQASESLDTVFVSTSGERLEDQSEFQTALLPDGIFLFKADVAGNSHRIAVLAESEQVALEAIESHEVIRNRGPLAGKRMKALARHGIHIGIDKDPPPPLAFVFPGQGSHYAGMGRELYDTIPIIRLWMDRAADIADFDILHRLFYDSEEDLQKTRWQQPALFTLEYAIVQHLISLGIRPAALAGHSLGELTALCLAGVYSFEDGFRIVNMRALCMDKACDMNIDPGGMLACDAPMDVIRDLISSRKNSYITNINSPRQTVLGGDSDVIRNLETDLKKLGFRSTRLRVSMSFHSPIMRCIHDELEAFVSDIEFHAPEIPVLSNTTAMSFPDDPSAIKSILMAHLESPVQWMQNVRSLWEDYGVRLFVEVGPREILSNIILDTLDEAECVQTCLPSAEVMIYKTALAQLFAKGHLEFPYVPLPIGTSQFVAASETPQSVVRPAPVTKFSEINHQPQLVDIIQREINSFVLESFGRFIKPNILDAIIKTHDPNFTEQKLNSFLAQTLLPTGDKSQATVKSHGESIPGLPSVQKEGVSPIPQPSDITETIISLIMEATGYERGEIDPDMDLKEDLSIRSSRLPVIMDALEGYFGIKIELEDFMDVRTINDISGRISMILSRDSGKSLDGKLEPRTQQQSTKVHAVGENREEVIKRVVFREVPLEVGNVQPVELSPTEPVVILSARGGTGLRRSVGDIFRRDYGANIVLWTFVKKAGDSDDDAFDLRTEQGTAMAERRLQDLGHPAGLVLIIDELLETELDGIEEVPKLLTGFFGLLKTFTQSSAKKFVLLIDKMGTQDGNGRLLTEGTIGMFLSAALEFGYVQFRAVALDDDTNLSDAIRGAMDRNRKPLQTTLRNGDAFTLEGKEECSVFRRSGGLRLGSGDVVVFSGGGYGVTHRLARAIVPYGCKIVLLGTTSIDADVDFRGLLKGEIPIQIAVNNMIDSIRPGLSESERGVTVDKILRAVDVVRNVEELRSMGIDASYFPCDVTDSERTNAVVEEIAKIHGRIDGVVHGAGILRDSVIRQMQLQDFSRVVDVKFVGAWNLFKATREKGLRFFSCLSSVVSVQGNPGQVNYAAGNRIMSALMSHLSRLHSSIDFKALMLPPIEGAGMAEDPEIRALMKRINAGYIHVDELADLFCREVLVGSEQDVWVLFMRTLPELSTVRLNVAKTPTDKPLLTAGTVTFDPEEFPMIDSVSRTDLFQGELRATRTFSHDRDLWISDHKPFQFLEHPIVSAIMALETFMETARMLCPYLRVRGIRDAWFLDIIECPPNLPRPAEVVCRRVGIQGLEVVCDASLSTRSISPSNKIIELKHPNYKGQVIMSGQEFTSEIISEGFADIVEEFDTPPVDQTRIIEQYSHRSAMQGRYRVIESVDGTCPGFIRGRIKYPQTKDFSNCASDNYQYSPYLLEALMQLVNFYLVIRNPAESRSMIPYRIGQVFFSRKCEEGENLVVEGYLRSQGEDGIIWDARGLDEQSNTILAAKSIMFRWFSL